MNANSITVYGSGSPNEDVHSPHTSLVGTLTQNCHGSRLEHKCLLLRAAFQNYAVWRI